jgi:glycosyltransferase involved in cell wall biosynthesis
MVADQPERIAGPDVIGVVVIGRNEGDRLRACLASLPRDVACVYVDSGSTDGSGALAGSFGATVVALDLSRPFTAARARNAGIAALRDKGFGGQYIQFVDGDCTLDPHWIETARAFLSTHPDVAVVCGRRRERHPDASVYNRLCDLEWDGVAGEAELCGGDALMRRDMLEKVGGYDDALIAGEEPELCTRIRAAGGRIWRLDAAKRGGFAYAQVRSVRQPGIADIFAPYYRRALAWGFGVPAAALGATAVSPILGMGVGALVALQVARLAVRRRGRHRWLYAVAAMGAKLPEALGIAKYHWQARRGREHRAIFYK